MTTKTMEEYYTDRATQASPAQTDKILTRKGTEVVKKDDKGAVNVSNGMAFQLRGAAYVDTSILGLQSACDAVISKVTLYSDTTPTGADLIVDINVNGVSIFLTANRPKILAGATSGESSTIENPNISQGDRVTVDIDQIGSSLVGGRNLYITIVFE